MVPSPPPGGSAAGSAPRASGDGPVGTSMYAAPTRCSPRERGWSLPPQVWEDAVLVLPARAGMVPPTAAGASCCTCAPRASGDGPVRLLRGWSHSSCSPRERGWSARLAQRPAAHQVLPARAGMVPPRRVIRRRLAGAPRASGDGPRSVRSSWPSMKCSPRERGWSTREIFNAKGVPVLPARAGMVRIEIPWCRCPGSAPRASGDGPSPVGLCGGESGCSPRERGWSRPGADDPGWGDVLPARAGMVPPHRHGPPGRRCAPRASGDGPGRGASSRPNNECSPRERGWSLPRELEVVGPRVLPARAGMVLGT